MITQLPDNNLDKRLNSDLPHASGAALKTTSSLPNASNSVMSKNEKLERTPGCSTSSLPALPKAKHVEKSELPSSCGDKNGSLNPSFERKERIKKDHINTSASNSNTVAQTSSSVISPPSPTGLQQAGVVIGAAVTTSGKHIDDLLVKYLMMLLKAHILYTLLVIT